MRSVFSVYYFFENKAMGWGSGACRTPFFGKERLFKFEECAFSFSGLKQGADHIANHVPEKTIAGELESVCIRGYWGKSCFMKSANRTASAGGLGVTGA